MTTPDVAVGQLWESRKSAQIARVEDIILGEVQLVAGMSRKVVDSGTVDEIRSRWTLHRDVIPPRPPTARQVLAVMEEGDSAPLDPWAAVTCALLAISEQLDHVARLQREALKRVLGEDQ